MIDKQRKLLEERQSKYLSIGITEGGQTRAAIGIPWDKTTNSYNMKTPNVYISKEDLADPEIMSLISKYEVIGCYISVPMDEYSFLENFPNLMDLMIIKATKLTDLSFMRSLKECRMLYLRDAKLKNLNDIIDIKKEGKIRYVICLGLDTCEIEDISSVLENEDLFYSEFLIWTPKGSGERDRWKGFKQDSKNFKIYEYIPKEK